MALRPVKRRRPGAESIPMVRPRFLAAALALAALLAGSAGAYSSGAAKRRATSPSLAQATFVVSGRGWGHGVGLAQWGAYGFAQQGASYDRILAHYYPGTTLGPTQVTRVRVLLAQESRRLSVSSETPFRVRDATGQVWQLAAGAQRFGPGLRVKPADGPAQQLPGPLLFIPGTSPMRFDGRPYRGQFQVSVANGALRAVNSVPLEGYLYGVVPSEMPHAWLPEALKAQAVAARSYALAARKTGSWFDLYPDTRSQVYRGIAGEWPSATQAVQATAGEVVLYGGHVVKTYFFSSSGGRTAAASEVWPGSPLTPYLVSVNDPYDTISPYHRWGPFVVAPGRLAHALSARGRLVDLRTTTGPSGRVRSVTAVGSQGEATVTGPDLRRALGLRSTWFRIGVLSLAPPAAPVTFGARGGRSRPSPTVRSRSRRGFAARRTTGWRAVRRAAGSPMSPSLPGCASTASPAPRACTGLHDLSSRERASRSSVSTGPRGRPSPGRRLPRTATSRRA